MSWPRSAGVPKAEDLPNGVKLVVTASDPRQVVKIKALGFASVRN